MNVDTKSECDKRITEAVHLVQASRFEMLALWKEWKTTLVWEEDSIGFLSTIGELDKRPVCLAWVFAKLNGVPVAFFDPCSELVCRRIIRCWIDQRCGEGAYLHDASNFHLVVHAIQRRKVVKP